MNDLVLIFDPLTWTLQWQPIFVSFIGLERHSVEVQVMRWTQANQLTNHVVIINKQLWGQTGRLQSGFALRLLFRGLGLFIKKTQQRQWSHRDLRPLQSTDKKSFFLIERNVAYGRGKLF